MDALIRRALEAVATESDAEKRDRLKRQTNPRLGDHFRRNTAELEELAYAVLDRAWADAMASDITPKVIEVKTVDFQAVDYVDEDLRGMRAYIQGRGGQIFSDILRTTRSQMPREEMVAAIDLHRNEIRTDFWGQYDKLQTQAREKMGQLPVVKLVELIQAGITSGAYYGTFPAAALTSAQVDPIIEAVAGRSKGNVTLLGSRTAIRQLSAIGLAYSDAAKDQILRTGQIGVYKGYPAVEVENFEDFYGNLVLPENEIWVVGQNAGRLTWYGNDPLTQSIPRLGFYLRWETAKEFGMLLYGVQRGRVGRIVLT